MKAKINIEGMSCASCAGHVEKELKKLPGAINVVVNAVMGSAHGEFFKNVSETQLKDAVKEAGYEPTGVELEDSTPSKSTPLGVYPNGHKPQNTELGGKDKPKENSEISMWKKKLWGVWLLTIPLAIIMYSEFIISRSIIPMAWITPSMLILSFPIIFIFGFKTIRMGIRGFYKLNFTMDSLIALGTILAYATGILSFYMEIANFAGVSGMIMTIFITGKFVEAKAKGKATSEIKKLLELGAKNAIVLRRSPGDDSGEPKEVEISVSEIKIGDILVVKPGEKIPTDGIVVKGSSSVDESMISGESLPVDKTIKSLVIGATINEDGILHIKATKIGKDTFLAHIIKLVEEAQGTKIPIQKVADKITNIFVPVILTLSLLTFLMWMFVFPVGLSKSLGIAIAVLVIACPCSLGLAVPISLTVGSGMGAKRGILIRKGEAIQTMKEIKTVVFDKTGTITKGKPEVVDFYTAPKISEKKLFKIAGSLEKLSSHPLSLAIVKRSDLQKPLSVRNFKNIRGKGIEGTISGKKIVIGNEAIMKDNKISIKGFEEKMLEFEENGETVMIVAEKKSVIGLIGVADAIKEDSAMAIRLLNKKGYRTVMITGDNERTARAIAKKVGIKEVIASVLPEEKKSKVEELQKRGMVAFVGDGINDAPALKQANVGIAIGTGTDIAIEAGDIVLAKGSLMSVVQSMNLSQATFSKIKQNLFWAFFYNAAAIPLAVAGIINPVVAELAMALSSITVVTNANLLRRKKI